MRHLTLAQNGNVENKAAHLQAAEKAFSKASGFFNPTSMPIDWARVQKNLAITLQDQGSPSVGTDPSQSRKGLI